MKKKMLMFIIILLMAFVAMTVVFACDNSGSSNGNGNNGSGIGNNGGGNDNGGSNPRPVYVEFTLDRIVLIDHILHPDDASVRTLKENYGATVIISQNTIRLTGSITEEFGAMNYTVNEAGVVTILGTLHTFNQIYLRNGHFSFGARREGFNFSFHFFNDDIWFEYAETFTLYFQCISGNPIEPIELQERALLTDLPIPVFDGFSFNGWSHQGIQWPMVLGRMPGSDHTLVASWYFHFMSALQVIAGEQRVRLTGLSPHGLSQTVLYVPDTFSGVNIVGIDTAVFRNRTNIRHISIGANITALSAANMFQGTTNLESITLRRTEDLTSINADVLAQIGNTVRFYVPYDVLELYKSNGVWSVAADRIFPVS